MINFDAQKQLIRHISLRIVPTNIVKTQCFQHTLTSEEDYVKVLKVLTDQRKPGKTTMNDEQQINRNILSPFLKFLE
jgi:hypothetical protein